MDAGLDDVVDREVRVAGIAQLHDIRRRGAVNPRLDQVLYRQVVVAGLSQPGDVVRVHAVDAHLHQVLDGHALVAGLFDRRDEVLADVVNRQPQHVVCRRLPPRFLERRHERAIRREPEAAGAASGIERALELEHPGVAAEREPDIASGEGLAAHPGRLQLRQPDGGAVVARPVALKLERDPALTLTLDPGFRQAGSPRAGDHPGSGAGLVANRIGRKSDGQAEEAGGNQQFSWPVGRRPSAEGWNRRRPAGLNGRRGMSARRRAGRPRRPRSASRLPARPPSIASSRGPRPGEWIRARGRSRRFHD